MNEHMTIAREEIFGPAAAAMPFDGNEQIADVMKRANGSNYGLTIGIGTTDVIKGYRVAHPMEEGTMWGNCYNLFDAAMPFGGFKQKYPTMSEFHLHH
ncbi:aldehyde dehydrogenase family protein [Bacillus sp. FSL W8-1127]|uniref:aldehyde dehydrogenase family protein n=2 Tax=Bacillus sp. FSL W8-1127 TaxID=2954710 RepID=UPI0030C9916E